MTLREIEDIIAKLPPDSLAAFREWFANFDGERWDEDFAEDAIAGRLEKGLAGVRPGFRG